VERQGLAPARLPGKRVTPACPVDTHRAGVLGCRQLQQMVASAIDCRFICSKSAAKSRLQVV
jgi:hypothetical protein